MSSVPADPDRRGESMTNDQLLMLFHACSRDVSKEFHKIFNLDTTRVIKWLMRNLNYDPNLSAYDASLCVENDSEYMKELIATIKNVIKEVEEDKAGRPKEYLQWRNQQITLIQSIFDGNLDKGAYMALFGEQFEVPLLLVFDLLNFFSVDYKENILEVVLKDQLMEKMDKFWFHPQFFPYAKFSCSILTNLTTQLEVCQYLYRHKPGIADQLMTWLIFGDDPAGCESYIQRMDCAAMVLCNLSRLESFQAFFIDEKKENGNPLYHIAGRISYPSEKMRLHLAGVIKNCLFKSKYHKFLIDDADILSGLLEPLAGGEQLSAEENECLPRELQYLPHDKERETSLEVRICLLECLFQLCQTREIREILREKNVYVILREYHKWETEEGAKRVLENIINILIRTEDEIGVSDYKEIKDEELANALKFHTIGSDEVSHNATVR